MLFNQQLGQITLKIVYYGPAMSGKTTNLEQIQNLSTLKHYFPLFSVKDQHSRTLQFDFLKLELDEIFGLTPSLHLFSVPGQSYYEPSRRLLLHNTDGVVFIADSTPNRLEDNQKAWQTLNTHLNSLGISIPKLPLVVQLNKQDLPNALSADTLRNSLGIGNSPAIEAIALTGKGVMDTFWFIVEQVLDNIKQQDLNSKLF